MSALVPLELAEQVLLRVTIGVRCSQARRQLGLSQRALARAMDRSPSWVREIEAREQFAPPYLLWALSKATGQPVGWFYGIGIDVDELAQQVLAALTQRVRAGAEPAGAPS